MKWRQPTHKRHYANSNETSSETQRDRESNVAGKIDSIENHKIIINNFDKFERNAVDEFVNDRWRPKYFRSLILDSYLKVKTESLDFIVYILNHLCGGGWFGKD